MSFKKEQPTKCVTRWPNHSSIRLHAGFITQKILDQNKYCHYTGQHFF